MSETLKKRAALIRSKIYKQLLARGAWKYRAFLRYLRLFKYFSMSSVRGNFLETYYVLMRYLDDIVDGDLPVPASSSDVPGYILEKIDFIRKLNSPKDDVDYLYLYCQELAVKMGQDFSTETADILESLLFDARRRDAMTIFPDTVLQRHFHQMDIRGTIRATLKIFNDDPDKYALLEPLGMACRYQYDLEDFSDDIDAGYVNISLEECHVFGIGRQDLLRKTSEGISRWRHFKALKGLELLDRHSKNVPIGKFSILERMTFPLVYANPARKRFEHVIKETGDVQDDYTLICKMLDHERRSATAQVLS